MTARPPRFTVARGTTALVLAGALVAVACRAELPTAAEVERMDVASVERTLSPTLAPEGTVYVVNDKPATREEAAALTASQIASIDVRRRSPKLNEIAIRTRAANPNGAQGPAGVVERLVAGTPAAGVSIRFDSTPSVGERSIQTGNGSAIRITQGTDLRAANGAGVSASGPLIEVPVAQPLIIIDGVRSNKEALNRIGPNGIASVEVVKREGAVRLYGAEGANGVIVVTTKK